MKITVSRDADELKWPDDADGAVPYWIYTDKDNYQRELERIWYGRHWLYCGLEAEVPQVGNYRTATLGERPVIMVRSSETDITVVENRCAHRGTKVCWTHSGLSEEFKCPYHQWIYDLEGNLVGVPFRRGVRGQGGMPNDFDPSQFGLRRLKVEVVNGVVWASFSQDTPAFREYLGANLWRCYERMFSGKKLRIVGYNRQRIHGNWKLMQENNKDPYHGALLHAFFATFGLFRPDQKNALEMDETGRHASITSTMERGGVNDVTGSLPGFDSTLQLKDPRLVRAVKELKGDETMSGNSIFPSVVLLQQVNSMQARQIVPRGPDVFDFYWTHFGYEDDDEEMRQRRALHANLFGPAGYVSADDSEAIAMQQQGITSAHSADWSPILMGGRSVERSNNMASETGVRGMYRYYRKVMGL